MRKSTRLTHIRPSTAASYAAVFFDDRDDQNGAALRLNLPLTEAKIRPSIFLMKAIEP
jgi:hypothetical protein